MGRVQESDMSRKPALPKPTARELELLDTLWRLGSATAREVHEARLEERSDITYANVLRLMQIMHGKGMLKRDEESRPHVYAPAHPQKSMRTGLLSDLINKAFAGSAKDLVLAALSGHVSKAEKDEIRRFLKESRDE
jgi:predicted transcriptional regulator